MTQGSNRLETKRNKAYIILVTINLNIFFEVVKVSRTFVGGGGMNPYRQIIPERHGFLIFIIWLIGNPGVLRILTYVDQLVQPSQEISKTK